MPSVTKASIHRILTVLEGWKGSYGITFIASFNDHLDKVLDRNLAGPSHHQTAHHTRCNRSVFSVDTGLKFLISLEAVREEKT
jgi:hypothetical protein